MVLHTNFLSALLCASSYFFAMATGTEDTAFDGVHVKVFDNGEWTGGTEIFLNSIECEIEPEEGHLGELVVRKFRPSSVDASHGYSVHTKYGQNILSCEDITELSAEEQGEDFDPDVPVHIHVVPDHRMFVWPSYPVGNRFKLRHIIGGDNETPVEIEPIHMHEDGTRIFELHNYLSEEDCDTIINLALNITDEENKLKRSSTGKTPGLNKRRTSDTAFDTSSPTAMKLKERAFEVLGFPYFDDRMNDGVQILRYNQTQAYITHMDYFTSLSSKEQRNHNYEARDLTGSNRFATVFFYLSDVEDGGETVFPYADGRPAPEEAYNKNADLIAMPAFPTKEDLDEEAYTDQYIEDNGYAEAFPKDSWERDMVRVCQSPRTLAFKPKKAHAVLFYSQTPDGAMDPTGLHGGCPVISGQKWAANLWVWNRPRNGNWLLNRETGEHVLKPLNQSRSIGVYLADDFPKAKIFYNMHAVIDYTDDDEEGENVFFTDVTAGTGQNIESWIGHRFSLHVGKDDELVWSAYVEMDDEIIVHTVSIKDLEPRHQELVRQIEAEDLDAAENGDEEILGPLERFIDFQVLPTVDCTFSGCALYYEDTFFSDLVPGEGYGVQTYVGHKWNIYANGDLVWHGEADPAYTDKETIYITPYMQAKVRAAAEEYSMYEETEVFTEL